MPPTHSNVWQVRELAKCIGECGYNVDVFDFFSTEAPIVERYDMVVDIHPKPMPMYREHLTPSCIKIAYLASSHATFRNSSESNRLEGVERRRGVRRGRAGIALRLVRVAAGPKFTASLVTASLLGCPLPLRERAASCEHKRATSRVRGNPLIASG